MPQHDGNRCECQAAATWLLRIVPNGTDRGVDHWAACDAHLAQAARSLMARNFILGSTLQLRAES